jgi:hypothetical protein
MSYLSQPLNSQIAQYIYSYAQQKGVDPNLALGIASYEGLNRSNPLATNPDGYIGGVPNTAVGPFQFGTAGLGAQLGITASTPWQTQVQSAVDYMASHSQSQITGQWHSIPDQGGWNSITAKGSKIASQLGLQSGAPPLGTSGSGTGGSMDDYYGTPQSSADTLSDLQQDYPNDPTLGGEYPQQSWADTLSDVQQDYPASAPSGGGGGGGGGGGVTSAPYQGPGGASASVPTNSNGTLSTAGSGNPFSSVINSIGGMIPGPAGQAIKAVGPLLSGILSGSGGAGAGGLPGPLGSILGGSGGMPNFSQLAGLNQSPAAVASQVPTATGTNTGGGVPVDITDTTSVASTGLNAASQAVGKLNQGLTQDTSAVTKATTADTQAATQSLTQNTTAATTEATSLGNFLGNLTEGPSGLLPRIGFIVGGGILLIFGLWMTGSGAVKRGV